jgi:RNA polymerase-interacting CarD/CdnL/TRCF family regulator
MIHFDFTPGDYVVNPQQKDWGIGQVQSIIKNKITVNFQNQGKQVINGEIIVLEKIKNEQK